MTDPIHLFDISAYLHRAMYVCYGDRCAETPATDERFIQHACGMLANTMEKLNVKRMIVCCDSTEPSFRCDWFPGYKAERKAHYPVFSAQMPRFLDRLRDMSVACLSIPRFEADDLIATAVHTTGERLVVASSDKDLLALISDSVRFYDPMKGGWITEANVSDKFGVMPKQLYDYVGLVGDASDGIPGVVSFGAKTAAKLLREFDSLDCIYDEARQQALEEFVTPRQLTTLRASREVAFLSRRLAQPFLSDHFIGMLPIARNEFEAPASGIVRTACG